MIGLSTQKAPSISVVLPHYIYGAVAFFVLTLLILLSSQSFIGHYFQPHLLTMTHIAALGWGTMIIFGALYQLLPVVLEVGLYSEKLAKITFWLFGSGIILLAYFFWNFSVGLSLQIAASVVFIAILLFVINIVQTVRKAVKWTIETDFITTAVMWLLLTAVFGILMSFNFAYPIFKESHLLYLKIHAHLGIIGWFLLLIIGVSSKLIPMFLLVDTTNQKKLHIAYYLINIGLIAFGVDLYFFQGTILIPLFAVIIVAGILFFISYMHEVFKNRSRKNLDIGLKHSLIAVIAILLPLLLGTVIGFNLHMKESILFPIYLVYGISIFLGFITTLILGQTFKTLPFIVWLYIFKKATGKIKVPLPKDLYSEKIAHWQLMIYLIGMLVLIAGVLSSTVLLIRLGSVLLLLTAILYNLNVFKILHYSLKANSVIQKP